MPRLLLDRLRHQLELFIVVPEEVRAAEDRELQDYLVTWVQGMSEHIASYDKARKARAKKVAGLSRRRSSGVAGSKYNRCFSTTGNTGKDGPHG